MADTITHYITARRFIKRRPELSAEFKRGMYFGAQGPDLFFFGGTKRSYALSGAIHEGDPGALFEGLAQDILGKDELYRGYALGVLLHYLGDRAVHPYIGWRCKTHPAPYAHIYMESSIDMCAYEREFGKSISTFDYDAVYRRDAALTSAVCAFWHTRLSSPCKRGYIARCLYIMGLMTKLFLRAKPAVLWLARFLGRFMDRDALLCHFKVDPDADVMNDANAVWKSPEGMREQSVEQLLDAAVEEFSRAYDEIISGQFRFNYKETFSYGC